MDHAAMGDAAPAAPAAAACPPEHAAMGHCPPPASTVAPPSSGQVAGMDRGAGGMDHSMRDFSVAPEVKKTATVQTISPMPADRMGEPGQGLEDVGHTVLVYTDLMAVTRNPDVRAPDRAMRIHLTGNMERYMWAFDGEKLSEVKKPIPFLKDERVRVTLVNDTMMGHPIHLHGHFFELVTGHGEYAPRKHTVQVQPGGTATFDVTTDAVGDWAFHCHMLYHMHAGMMQVVSVRPRGGDAA
jgi:FtsP/CotA-like multicopper oxidase with cupredoxin domain